MTEGETKIESKNSSTVTLVHDSRRNTDTPKGNVVKIKVTSKFALTGIVMNRPSDASRKG